MEWFLMDEAKGGEEGGGAAVVKDEAKGAPPGDTKPAAAAPAPAAKPPEGNPTFPDNWRELIAGDNADHLKTLQRLADPAALYKSYESLRQKMSSGELKVSKPYPDKGTPEEQSAWRKETGIPESPDKYDLTLANGVVVGEDDKPMVDEFLKFAHANHQPPESVKKTLEWVLGSYREQLEQKAAEATAERVKSTEDTLRADWGGDYRMNVNAIGNLLDSHLSQTDKDQALLRERIMTSIKQEPLFAKLWAGLAREVNPMATLTDGASPMTMESLDGKIKELETLMRTNRPEYNRREAEYRGLLEARDKIKARG